MGLTMSLFWSLQRLGGRGGVVVVLFLWGPGLGTQSLGVCQSPGGGRDEFPGFLADCLPPSAHLLLPKTFSSSFLLPPSLASSLYASPVCWPWIWGVVGVLGGVVGRRMEGQTPICAFLPTFPPWCRGEGRGGLGNGRERREDVA